MQATINSIQSQLAKLQGTATGDIFLLYIDNDTKISFVAAATGNGSGESSKEDADSGTGSAPSSTR